MKLIRPALEFIGYTLVTYAAWGVDSRLGIALAGVVTWSYGVGKTS